MASRSSRALAASAAGQLRQRLAETLAAIDKLERFAGRGNLSQIIPRDELARLLALARGDPAPAAPRAA
jgi:hypothetical protein